MSLIKINIAANQEVMNILEHYFVEHNLQSGAIVSLIGAVDSCCISNMPKHNAKEDMLNTYEEPFEILGCGEIRNGKPHIHCTLGKKGILPYPVICIGPRCQHGM